MGRVIELRPEFGCELACGIPYAYWLHQRGELDQVITCKGMRPFYYFCDNVIEHYTARTVGNEESGMPTLPNSWIHHNSLYTMGKSYDKLTDEEKYEANGVLDYREWTSPPYKEVFKADAFKSDKPIVVISNSLVMAHQNIPRGYLDCGCLKDLFTYLTDKGYLVVYKRPLMNEEGMTIDQNEYTTVLHKMNITATFTASDGEEVEINDHELARSFKEVVLFDELVEQGKQQNLSYNEMQLRIFSHCDKFIAVGGGNSILCSLFGGDLITYVITSGEGRPGYFEGDSYYKKLGGSKVHAVIDPEKEIEERGYNDYEKLINKVKELF